MSAATGFRRLGYAVVALIVAIFGALGVVSFLVPADQVRETVKADIRAVTGLDPVLNGAVSVSLFPYGKVSFSDVVLGDSGAGQPPLIADRLTVKLRFFPLLTGRIEVADVALEGPRITLALREDGGSNWAPLIAALTRAHRPEASRRERGMSFSEIRIDDGTVIIRDNRRGLLERLSDVNISLAWPAISKSFAATGSLAWRGEKLDLSVAFGDFGALLLGQRSGLKIKVGGAPAKFSFDGALSLRPTLKVEGAMAADSPSLRKALIWAGQRPLPGGGFESFSITGKTNIVGGTIALTGVSLELDGNTAEGVLTFATDGRQTLQGTLAAETLDLSSYISAVRLLAANQREWNRVPIALDGLNSFDLDLRLSAAKIMLSGAKLGRTAVAANLRSGKLVVTVGESRAYGGVIKGSLTLAAAAKGGDFQSQLHFSDIDLEACMGDLFGIRRLEGKGDLAFAIEGGGENVLALTRTLDGTATLAGRKGALTGLNVEQLLRRLERRPLSGGSEFRSGRTPFELLAAKIRIAAGTATVEEMTLQGPAVRLALAGSASIPARDLDLKGTASLVTASTTDGRAPFELPFVVQGPWDDPIMLPDPEILIRRSGAAAPLLDAVRDRRAREAVRSAIERLTGAKDGTSIPGTEKPAE
ncbi:MAG: AsmA family protein [Pseudorhodoplanes sp.]|nr:MAG: AsmA family protein [Pseudorhodoplanes sp.]